MDRKKAVVWGLVVLGLALGGLFLFGDEILAGPIPYLFAPKGGAVPGAPSAGSGMAWSSGWTPIAPGQDLMFDHGVGGDPDDLAIDLWFRDADGDLGIHRANYGGLERLGRWYGVYWHHLDADSVEVRRLPDDAAADEVLIRVWAAPQQSDTYDCGWTSIAQGEEKTCVHNLDVPADELAVALWFKSATGGVHHLGYGGLTLDAPPSMQGAYWHNLTDSDISVTRRIHDTYLDQVRVVVAHADAPHYDSDWQEIDAGAAYTFTHNQNWPPEFLLVRAECYDPTQDGLEIHQMFAGGDHGTAGGWQGAHLQNLTASTIEVARRVNDTVCPQVRVRIWRRAIRAYLPSVLREAQ